MRAIGHLPDETTARTFGDYLAVEGMDNQVEPDDTGQWTVWVCEDEHLARAGDLLNEFRQNPKDPRYRRAVSAARDLREQEERDKAAWARRVVDRQSLLSRMGGHFRWLTVTLISVSVTVALFRFLGGAEKDWSRLLTISNYLRPLLPEVHSGEVWRLFTPIFIHFTWAHLLFNMLWLLDLGGMIEARLGSIRLAVMVAIIALVSNLAQFFWGGPGFGGMSGVVYGLFGYIWLRGRIDPDCGLGIDSTNAMLMVVWFFVCMSGLVGPIANMAHGAGLGVGLLWGYLAVRFGGK